MKLSTIILALFAVIVLSSCGFKRNPSGGDLQLAYPDGTAGIRTIRESFASLAEMTGVPENNTVVNAVLRATRPRLSTDGITESVSAVTVSANGIMAAGFCQELYRSDRLLPAENRRIYKEIDTTKGPSFVALSTREKIVKEYARMFWRREASEVESQILLDLMAEVVLGETNSAGMTETMLLMGCTAAASSPDAISN